MRTPLRRRVRVTSRCGYGTLPGRHADDAGRSSPRDCKTGRRPQDGRGLCGWRNGRGTCPCRGRRPYSRRSVRSPGRHCRACPRGPGPTRRALRRRATKARLARRASSPECRLRPSRPQSVPLFRLYAFRVIFNAKITLFAGVHNTAVIFCQVSTRRRRPPGLPGPRARPTAG